MMTLRMRSSDNDGVQAQHKSHICQCSSSKDPPLLRMGGHPLPCAVSRLIGPDTSLLMELQNLSSSCQFGGIHRAHRQETAVSITKEMSGCRWWLLIHICEYETNKHSFARLSRHRACVPCTWQLKRAFRSSEEWDTALCCRCFIQLSILLM